MTYTTLTGDIQEFNLAFLLLAQRMLRSDWDTGKSQLKIGDDMADLLFNLTTEQLIKLASCNQFLFRPGKEGIKEIQAIVDSSNNNGLANTQAADLLDSNPPDDID